MASVTVNRFPVPPAPPAEFVLRLTQQEAQDLVDLVTHDSSQMSRLRSNNPGIYSIMDALGREPEIAIGSEWVEK